MNMKGKGQFKRSFQTIEDFIKFVARERNKLYFPNIVKELGDQYKIFCKKYRAYYFKHLDGK